MSLLSDSVLREVLEDEYDKEEKGKAKFCGKLLFFCELS